MSVYAKYQDIEIKMLEYVKDPGHIKRQVLENLLHQLMWELDKKEANYDVRSIRFDTDTYTRDDGTRMYKFTAYAIVED